MALRPFVASAQLFAPRPKLEHNGLIARAKADIAVVNGMREGGNIVATKLKLALDEAMDAPVWNWTGIPTKRSNGRTVGSPRDIVDTGKLKKSGQVKLAHYPSVTNFSIKYLAPHANIVYHGGAIQPYGNKNAATQFLPGRPWVGAVLNGTHGITKFDLKTPYAEALKRHWPFGFR